ncbi:MAG: transglycosylase SLT domain-containing protein [Deltaproteobacteria bacterium]|nr:transglycosylase SLT domain-containing protein [Deltaproteobacteria bacterium]
MAVFSFSLMLLLVTAPAISGYFISEPQKVIKYIGSEIYPYTGDSGNELSAGALSRIEEYLYWGRRIQSFNPALTAHDVFESGKAVIRYSRAYSLSPQLIVAIIKVESNGNHRAVSPKGARGLMQVMPWWPKELGIDGDLFSIDTNIRIGSHILSENIRKFGKKEGILRYYRGNIRTKDERYYVKVQEAMAKLS